MPRTAPHLLHGRLRSRLPMLLLAAGFALAPVLGLAAFTGSASAAYTDNASSRVTDMTEIELAATSDNLAQLQSLGIATTPSDRAGYVRADVSTSQVQDIDALGLSYEKGSSFLLIEGGRSLAGEAFVTGNNGTNMNIIGYDTIDSPITIAGAPAGKTVTKVDLSVVLNYPQMCYIYILLEHPSQVLFFDAWDGNQHSCSTANLNQSWNNIHSFDFADINGVWHLLVQETNGTTTGYLDYWSLKVYYLSNDTPTPTRTPTRTATPTPKSRLRLPVILAGY
jgi:subtilisin-like proprotein convertase family protein